MKKFLIILVFLSTCCTLLRAQVGDHRNDFAIGVNGGYVLSNITFQPEVSQAFHGGVSGGLSFRYICEKYFKSICSIYAEVNYASAVASEQDPWGRDLGTDSPRARQPRSFTADLLSRVTQPV